MLDAAALIPAEQAPDAWLLLGFALLLVGGVIGATLGYQAAQIEDED